MCSCVCGAFFLCFNVCLGIRFLFSIIQSIHKHSACLTQVLVRAFSQRPDNDGLSSILSGHLCIYNMNRNNTQITFNEIDLDSFFCCFSCQQCDFLIVCAHSLVTHTARTLLLRFYAFIGLSFGNCFSILLLAARNASLKIEWYSI